jgi:hypothetical protein
MVLFMWMKQWKIEPGTEEAAVPALPLEVLDRVGSL